MEEIPEDINFKLIIEEEEPIYFRTRQEVETYVKYRGIKIYRIEQRIREEEDNTYGG